MLEAIRCAEPDWEWMGVFSDPAGPEQYRHLVDLRRMPGCSDAEWQYIASCLVHVLGLEFGDTGTTKAAAAIRAKARREARDA